MFKGFDSFSTPHLALTLWALFITLVLLFISIDANLFGLSVVLGPMFLISCGITFSAYKTKDN